MLSSAGNLTMTIVILAYMGLLAGIIILSTFIFHTLDVGLLITSCLAIFLLGIGTVVSEKRLDKIEWQH
jgi:hypothetical protein